MSGDYLQKIFACNSTISSSDSITTSSPRTKQTVLDIVSGKHSKNTECIDKFDKQISEIELQKYNVESEKREDGSSKIKKKTGKGFWNKLKRWGANLGTTLKNMGKSFIGIDQNGKWHPWECVKNVGLTALCFVPYIGPVVRIGLGAYGLYKGVPGTIEGIKDLKKAETDEEKDAAQQKIIGNGLVSILSICGIKGVGKAFRVNPATAPKAVVAKAGTTTASKIISSGKNFVNDITVNAVKGALHEAGRGFNIFKTTNFLKRGYIGKITKANKSISEQITELEAKINAETNPNYRALFKEQYDLLKIKQQELSSIGRSTQSQLAGMRTQNAVTRAESRLSHFKEVDGKISFTRNGRKYTIDPNDPIYKEFTSAISKSNKAYAKQLADIITRREQIMIRYAKKPNKYTSKLDNYTQTRIRNKYTNPEELQQGIESLEGKLTNIGEKIAEFERKLANATGRSRNGYAGQITRMRKVEASLQEELAVCKAIKFKKWYRPSTWFKNQYQLAMNGKNNLGFGSAINSNIYKSLGTLGYMTALAQRNPIYSDALFYTKELSAEQTEELINVMTQYSEAFKIARQNILEAQDDETISEWDKAFDALNENYQKEVERIISGNAPDEIAQNSGNQQAEETASQSTSQTENETQSEEQNASEEKLDAVA